MYRIATKKRKYSPTPIVKVSTDENGKEQEDIVCIVTLKKKEGEALSEEIVRLLNDNIAFKKMLYEMNKLDNF